MCQLRMPMLSRLARSSKTEASHGTMDDVLFIRFTLQPSDLMCLLSFDIHPEALDLPSFLLQLPG